MEKPLKRSGYADKTVNKQTERERIIEDMTIIRFGERLKSAMDSQGLTNMSLSKISGLSETTIRKYVQGKIYPGIDSAALVAHACNVPLEWLISGKSDKQNNNPQQMQHENQELNILLQRMSARDVEQLIDAFYNIGIKGVLERLQQPTRLANDAPQQLEPVAQGSRTLEEPEEEIKHLHVRESLKEIFSLILALAGNEQKEREILQVIKSCGRAESPGSNTTTPDQEVNNAGKKSA